MSFSLGLYSDQRNKKRRWAHDNALFGTRKHIDAFLQTLGLSNVKNPEYIRALDEIRPLIEMNLIQLSSDELPDGAAFRIPEHDYIGISMNKDNLKGKSQTIEYIGNVLEIAPCQQQQQQQQQSDLSCYLPYLYPYWYASSKNASFMYADGVSTHYKSLSINDMQRFRFLKLTTSMIELKKKLNWDAFMTTPQEVIHYLKAIKDYNSLHDFMTRVTNPQAERPIPIDSMFVNVFIEKCKELELVMTFEQFNATRKLIIDSTGILSDTNLMPSNWYKIVVKILQLNGIVDFTEEVRGLIICVVYFEILMPLGIRFWTLNYGKYVMQGINFPELLTKNPQYGDGKLLFDKFEGYCMNNKFTETERTEIKRINPNANLIHIDVCKQSCDSLFENIVNKSNCGIMNYNLTGQILAFMKRWFLNGAESNINKLFGALEPQHMLHAFESDYAKMMSNYGKMYRNSTPGTDLIFAVCLNLLLFHLFPQNTPVGYYLGQCMVASKYGDGFKYSSMNAELTIARSANTRNIGVVRKLTFMESGHETGPETDDDADDADAADDDYLGGKSKNHRRTRRKLNRNTRRNTRRKLNRNTRRNTGRNTRHRQMRL